MNKYELTKEKIVIGSVVLHRIRAIRDFGAISKGTIGGFIESEANLSQYNDCWVYGGARVYGGAQVYENAEVSGDTRVYENARVFGNIRVDDGARIYGNTLVYGNALIDGNARVYGAARVYGNALVGDRARVYGNTLVYGDARVFGDACVYGNAQVYGNARVFGDARVYERVWIRAGVTKFDVKNNLSGLISNSLDVFPISGKYILWKRVNTDLTSQYENAPKLQYVVGETITVKADPRWEISCASGIHCSTANYYPPCNGSVHIALEIKIKDIITCQEGKVRCKRAKVLEVVTY